MTGRPGVTLPAAGDAAAFRSFELANWGDGGVATSYSDWFGPLTVQTIPALLNAAYVTAGSTVLDVASGPGYVAAAVADLGAGVTGVDFSAAMVAQAKARFPGIAFQEGDAEALAFPGGQFDAVLMNFGLLHLSRPDVALAEAGRVLRRGGRLAFTVWAPPAQAIGFGLMLGAIERGGAMNVALPPGPPFFRFAEADECRRAVVDAGLTAVSVETLPLVWRLPSGDALVDAFEQGTGRTRSILKAQTPAQMAAIRQAVAETIAPYRSGDGYDLPTPGVLTVAAKP